MSKTKVALIAAAAVGAVGVGAVATAVVVVALAKREPRLFTCGTGKEVEYVLASGPEYMIINPTNNWGRNSFLISNEAGAIPRNWLYLGIPISAVGADGFTLAATESRPFIKTITFDVKARSLVMQYGVQARRREVLTCKPSTDFARVQAVANNVPVEYLLSRKSAIPFLNPSLGQRSFNLSLYNAIRSKKNSTYAVYQLLAGVPGSQLTGDESMVMADARKALIKANSSEMSLWEFAGTYRYSWEFANEQGEANLNAGNWCRNQGSGSLSEYTGNGFKVVGSTPEVRSTNGWVRQEYPDGRFSGYVKYQAQCDGTTYSLVKEGSVDNVTENSYDPYD